MRPVDPHPIDEFDLELLEAGADLPPQRAAVVLTDPSFGPARAEIMEMKLWWRQHHTPLPVAPSSPARRWAWSIGIAMVAACLLLARWIPSPAPYRAMGMPEIDVMRTRDGQPVEASDVMRGGDRLSVALAPDAARYVTVATLQEDGVVSLLVTAQRVPEGSRFELPGQMVLDDYTGREWLVVSTSPDPSSKNALIAEMQSLLPDPSAHASDMRFVTEITRGSPPK